MKTIPWNEMNEINKIKFRNNANNMFVNEQEVTGEIKREIETFLERKQRWKYNIPKLVG